MKLSCHTCKMSMRTWKCKSIKPSLLNLRFPPEPKSPKHAMLESTDLPMVPITPGKLSKMLTPAVLCSRIKVSQLMLLLSCGILSLKTNLMAIIWYLTLKPGRDLQKWVLLLLPHSGDHKVLNQMVFTKVKLVIAGSLPLPLLLQRYQIDLRESSGMMVSTRMVLTDSTSGSRTNGTELTLMIDFQS